MKLSKSDWNEINQEKEEKAKKLNIKQIESEKCSFIQSGIP